MWTSLPPVCRPLDLKERPCVQGESCLQEIHQRIQRGDSFAFETTLSGRSYAQSIPQWRATDYHVKLIFLSLPTVEIAIARVASRVAQGGHAVAEDVIRRRFDSGLRNFHNLYNRIVDSWILCDNSGLVPRQIACGDNP